MTRATSMLGKIVNVNSTGGGTNYLVRTPAGARYLLCVDFNSDLVWQKSVDGINWTYPVVLYTGTVTALAVTYDRWILSSGGLIHLAWTESGTHTTRYRTLDTENSDALSTETVIFTGVSAASGSRLSLARSRGGNVHCNTVIDAGVEGGHFKLANADVPNGAWSAALTNPEALASVDQIIMLPGWAADNQDMLAIFIDASANQIDRYVYDDSANSWANTNIGTIVELQQSTAFPNFAAVTDILNSRAFLIFWNATDTANADLECYLITESAITAKTSVVLDGVDDQGLCALALDETKGWLYAFYFGKSDGSETWTTAVKLYYKISTDFATTWGAETAVEGMELTGARWLTCNPRFTNGSFDLAWYDNVYQLMFVNSQIPIQPRASHQMFGG